jgi:hypothetical protein
MENGWLRLKQFKNVKRGTESEGKGRREKLSEEQNE